MLSGVSMRTRSANSVNISNEVHIITASSGPDTSQAEEQTASYEPVPLQTNSVKIPVLQRSLSETGLEHTSTEVQPKTEKEEQEGSTPTSTSFPSLPDTVLKTMGLFVGANNLNTNRESLTEDDIENRFTSLSLAFKTDQLTLSTRLELQQRQRDQAECNMSAEVTRLKTAIYKLNRVYVDSESVENLTQIQTLVDILQQATDRVSSSAEMFGAVQQEQRLSIATEVLMTHVENVKRSFEKMSIELEEVKRVLAENNIIMEESSDLTDEPAPRTHRYRSLAGIVTLSKKISSKRRASIAALPRPLSSPETRSVTSPVITTMEPRSRRENVVSTIRRKTSLSPIASHTSTGLDIHEWSDKVPDTMEEIEETPEIQKESLAEELMSSYNETCKVNEETCSPTLPFSNKNLLPVGEILSLQDVPQDKLTSAQAEGPPRPLQRMMPQVGRIVAQARFKIKEFDQNHRATVLKKVRFYVAVVLVAVAAWFLLWIVFSPTDAKNRRCLSWYTLEEILRSYIKLRHNGPPPT